MTKPAATKPPARRKHRAKQTPTKFTKAQIASALVKTRGVIAETSRALADTYDVKCSRQLIYNAMERWPDLHELRIDAAEEIKDIAEGGLLKALRAEEPWAIRYYLSNKAKDRGYGSGTQIEVSGKDGSAII